MVVGYETKINRTKINQTKYNQTKINRGRNPTNCSIRSRDMVRTMMSLIELPLSFMG